MVSCVCCLPSCRLSFPTLAMSHISEISSICCSSYPHCLPYLFLCSISCQVSCISSLYLTLFLIIHILSFLFLVPPISLFLRISSQEKVCLCSLVQSTNGRQRSHDVLPSAATFMDPPDRQQHISSNIYKPLLFSIDFNQQFIVIRQVI